MVIILSFFITDELFGIAIARPGHLNPWYSYGAILFASPCWAVGTALGAIAGNNAGEFSGNYFVSDTLKGINRVNYSQKAEPVAYETVQTKESVAEDFKKLTVKFVVEDEVIKTKEFNYGQTISNLVFPEILVFSITSTRSVYMKVGLVNQVSFRAVEDVKPTIVGAGVISPTNLLNGVQLPQDKVEVKPSKADEYKTRLKDA